ncbi:restriction endonuclease subunit S [Bifidobacterium adolescentis]|uniref:restriction endonuclease subunit S n=1 Tax=Bifidobacterium adolescentis TaxID=1680 RepID=UPI0022DEBE21|nr:restriction endonuclease subunit S [Bifidobacterium adolescentis]
MTDKPQFVGQKVKLSDICSIVSGATPKTTVKDYWGGDIKWITPSELNDDSHVIYNTAKHLTEAGFASARLRMFPEGTVLLTTRAPIGKVAIAGEPMCCNQGFKNLVCSDAVNNEYLYRYLKNRSSELQVLGRGATFKELSKKEVAAYEINLPPLKRQLEAVEKLALVDKQVVIAKTQLDKLDSLVKSRFVEMFGDLKSDTNGWPIKPFETFAIIDTHMANDLTPYLDMPHIGIDSIESGTGRLSGYRTVAEDGIISGKYPFTPEHLIYSKIRPSLNKVALPDFSGVCSADAYPILPIAGECNRVYLAEVMRSAYFLEYILPLSGRAQMPKVNKKALSGFSMPLPPIELQQQFAAFVAQVDKSRFVAQQQIEKLQMLYDSLAQEYFGD